MGAAETHVSADGDDGRIARATKVRCRANMFAV